MNKNRTFIRAIKERTIPDATFGPKILSKKKITPMRHSSIICILCTAALLLLWAACKKNTAPTNAFSGIYIEQAPAGTPLRLDFTGNSKVIVTGGKLNNQYWTTVSDTFSLVINSSQIFFNDPVNSKNSAEYWYHLSTTAGVRRLVLSPCPPGSTCVEDYDFLQQP